MSQAEREGFEQALRECASEPIHQIGAIQPHGAALVFDANPLHAVLQASENAADFLGQPKGSAIGKPLIALLGEPAVAEVGKLIQTALTKHSAAGALSVTCDGVPIDLQAHLYGANGQWVLELERDEGTLQEALLAQLQFQQTLLEFDAGDDLTQYLNEIAKLVRKLTGYDSVMVYQFNADWDGEVVAQDRIEAAPSYLGMHFPASDIPPQARRLYTANLVRIVANIDAQPVPISPTLNPVTGEPLDMTYSALRSLSPIHLEYLRNIGVAASMVISLIRDGKLWGLVACHHLTPRRVSFVMRESAIFISRMISAKLSSVAAIEQHGRMEQATALVSDLVKSIAVDDEMVVLNKLLPRLIDLLDATGVIVVIEGQPHVHGATPDNEAVRAMLDWLDSQPSAGEVFACDRLGQRFAPALAWADVVSGVLTTALSRDMRNGIVWLRREKPRTVKWAGDYQTGLAQNAAGNFRLTPRKSFEIWTETWQGRSDPWSLADIGIAVMLSLSLPEALKQKDRLEAEQARFRQAHLVSEATVQQFNKLTAAVPGVVYQFLTTPNGSWTFLYLSKGIEGLYEVTAEAAYRDHSALTDCILAEDRVSHRQAVEHAAANLTLWSNEHRIRTPSGKLKWVRGEACPERQEDGSILWNGILTDITERKQAELDLARSIDRYHGILYNMMDAYWRVDEKGRITEANEAICQMHGYSKEELLLMSIADFEVIESADDTHKHIETIMREGHDAFESQHRCRDGRIIDVEISASLASDAPGNVDAFHRDITERKKIEAELERHRQHLESLVQERTAALSIAKEAAEAANRAKTIFLSTMSHELRTPMNGIMGMTGLALRKATDPKQVDYLTKVTQSSEKLLALISDILEFTKAESEALARDETSFILADILESVSKREGQKAEGKGIKFLVMIDPCLAGQPVLGDPQHLEHVLLALTDNAIKFTSQGSVTVRVKADEDNREDILLRFEVSDTGIGISAEDRQRLFTPFEQMDGSMTRKYGGSGLGLALSQRLTHAMGGDMGVDSQIGAGSTFWFTMRLGKSAGAIPPAPI